MYAKSTRPSAKRDDQIARPRRAQTCELRAKRAMRMCPQSGQIFFTKFLEVIKLVFLISIFLCIEHIAWYHTVIYVRDKKLNVADLINSFVSFWNLIYIVPWLEQFSRKTCILFSQRYPLSTHGNSNLLDSRI